MFLRLFLFKTETNPSPALTREILGSYYNLLNQRRRHCGLSVKIKIWKLRTLILLYQQNK